MSASALWTEVVARYDATSLITLTNRTDRSANAVNTAVGEKAAQAIINLWPIHAQVIYDATDATHVEVAVTGVIAQLWRWGGTATESARVKWEEVFGDGGLVEKVRRTGPRGRQGPSSNSGTTTSTETVNGRPTLGWSDRGSLPPGMLPRTMGAE